MRITKRLAATLLAFCMIALMIPNALADDPKANEITATEGTGTTVVNLTAAGAAFKVTVPTSITISVGSDGNVTCPSDVNITNDSGAAVKVTAIQMKNAGEWKLTNYADDLSKEKFGQNKLSFSLSVMDAQKKTALDAATTTSSGYATAKDLEHSDKNSWTDSWTISGGGSKLPITFAAKASPIKDEIASASAVKVADLIFTVAWVNDPSTTA